LKAANGRAIAPHWLGLPLLKMASRAAAQRRVADGGRQLVDFRACRIRGLCRGRGFLSHAIHHRLLHELHLLSLKRGRGRLAILAEKGLLLFEHLARLLGILLLHRPELVHRPGQRSAGAA
jgi:hypothetical protein